ncbi:indolepyruvate ferredoxin oxidoreductase subunit alpha [Candidatus Poribacteria bacterium]|nr:indolepyruvate ferredoxin oxidoreductase subunit alpha [Candidatus Poribacteria bacterium]
MKKLLSGNEAVARGAYESGVIVASAYPGTPSTEILETVAAEYPEIYAEWSPNEKVAFEVGVGASFAGARVLVTMKHVGVNVAADPLFTMSYTGVKGGFVLLCAGDPGMHSSQNEQDNRNYAKFAKIPMLEPSDSQEAKEFVKMGFSISEQYDTPIIVRITTRIAHSKSLVEMEDRVESEIPLEFVKEPRKFVMIPAHGRLRHVVVEDRLKKLKEFSEEIPIQKMEIKNPKIGIITSGISYQYCQEVLPEASVLKLGMTNPIPKDMIRDFAGKVEKLFVVEELDPFLEDQILQMGISVQGVGKLTGELSPDYLAEFFQNKVEDMKIIHPTPSEKMNLPARPPAMCAGCPHRSVFYTLKRKKLTVTGDIGCYTLGVLPPLETMDTCVCMGASVGSALGIEKATGRSDNVVAVIGDSTFVHSGITGLVDMVYNKSRGTVIILDNDTTAMTGRQEHPGTGVTLMGEETKRTDFIKLAKALGVENTEVVNPYDLEALDKAIDKAVNSDELSVIVTNQPCLLLRREKRTQIAEVDLASCIGCQLCLRLGCPAISVISSDNKKVKIDSMLCSGCMVCADVCKSKAIISISV